MEWYLTELVLAEIAEDEEYMRQITELEELGMMADMVAYENLFEANAFVQASLENERRVDLGIPSFDD